MHRPVEPEMVGPETVTPLTVANRRRAVGRVWRGRFSA